MALDDYLAGLFMSERKSQKRESSCSSAQFHHRGICRMQYRFTPCRQDLTSVAHLCKSSMTTNFDLHRDSSALSPLT